MAVYLDIETLDFFSDPHIKALPRNEQLQAMRLGCAVTYDAQADMWEEWTAEQSMDLCEAFILRDRPIVGWNVQDFDLLLRAMHAGPDGIRSALQNQRRRSLTSLPRFGARPDAGISWKMSACCPGRNARS